MIPGNEQRNTKPQQKGPMDAALRYLARRARTVREMELYLDGQQYGEYEVQQTVDRLLELGYLDDTAFAAEFVRTRLNTKPISRRKLQEQLLGHHIDRTVVESTLLTIDDGAEQAHALEVAQKYTRQIPPCPDRKERLTRRLIGRGFTYEDAQRAVQEALHLEGTHA